VWTQINTSRSGQKKKADQRLRTGVAIGCLTVVAVVAIPVVIAFIMVLRDLPEEKKQIDYSEARTLSLNVRDAAAVYAAFEQDGPFQGPADTDLKNKWFAVKGKIMVMGEKEEDGVGLSIGKDDTSFYCVDCIFKDSEKGVLAKLRRGQTVVIGGLCTGMVWVDGHGAFPSGGQVMMVDCWLYRAP